MLAAAATLACATPAVAAGTPPARTAIDALPGDFFGASGALAPGGDLAQLLGSGAGDYRTDASWPAAEPNAPVGGVHTYHWASADATATALAQAGLRWYPILDYTPIWASSGPNEHYAPNNPSDFAAYAAAFAARYGPGGSFWATNPGLPDLPVQEYEIWNEENNPTFWVDQTTAPAQYATLVLDAHAAIHAVQPDATVVLGGVLDSNLSGISFLAAMAAADPGVLGEMDAIGWHPYEGTQRPVIAGVVALRAFLDSHGAASVPIEVNEFDSNSAFTSSATWAASLAAISTQLAGSGCDVTHVFPFMDSPANAGQADSASDGWFVLFHNDNTPSLPGAAYLAAVHRLTTTPVVTDSLCRAAAGTTRGAQGSSTTTTHARVVIEHFSTHLKCEPASYLAKNASILQRELKPRVAARVPGTDTFTVIGSSCVAATTTRTLRARSSATSGADRHMVLIVRVHSEQRVEHE
jgi:hypothetical protein